jgi:hypothetical protein
MHTANEKWIIYERDLHAVRGIALLVRTMPQFCLIAK